MGLADAIRQSQEAYRHDQQSKTPPRRIIKFGYNLSISTSEETIDAGGVLRTYETSAYSAELKSSNGGDTQLYEVQGLDANHDWQVQQVTATGTTEAAVPGTWFDIFRIKNLADAGSPNVGSIDVFKAGDDTNIKSRIIAGANQSTTAVFTVPRGYIGYLRRWYFSTNTGNMQGRIYQQSFGKVPRLQLQATMSNGSDGGTYDVMPYYDEKTTLEMRGELVSGGSAGTLVGAFDMILVAK